MEFSLPYSFEETNSHGEKISFWIVLQFHLRIDCWLFSFPWGMNEKNRRSPPYENVHVGFLSFIPQGNENTSTVNSYNLISYHFHTKSKGKQP